MTADLTLIIQKGEAMWTPEGLHVVDGSGVTEVADNDTQVTFATQEAFDNAMKVVQSDRARTTPKSGSGVNGGVDSSTMQELLKNIEESKMAAFTAKRETEELQRFVHDMANGMAELQGIVKGSKGSQGADSADEKAPSQPVAAGSTSPSAPAAS